jgi:hypothetical protein
VDGSLFQIRGAAEANERSPSVLRRVDGTTSDDVDADRNRLLESRSAARCRSAARYIGAAPCKHR